MIAFLPASVASTIVSEWLEIKSLARLDSAHCVRKYRERFLTLCRFQSIPTLVKCYGPVLSWLIIRRITVANLDIGENLTEQEKSLFKQYTEQCGTKIRTITIGSYDISVGAAIVTNCNTLTAFSCGRIGSLDLGRVLKCNPKLTRLNVVGICGRFIFGFRDVSLRIVVYDRLMGGNCSHTGALIARTPNLQKLSIEHDGCGPRPTVPIMHTSCMHLRSLKLSQIDKIDANLAKLVVLCPNVVNLQFVFCKDLSDDGMLLVAKSLLQLRTISVLYCSAVTDITIKSLADYRAGTLELLHLSSNRFTRAALDYARMKCPKLAVQVFGSCTTERDNTITQQISTISHLDMRVPLSDDIIEKLGCCESVEVVFLHAVADYPLSDVGLVSMCSKWPCLRVLVVQKEDEMRFVELVRHIPQLTIATDSWDYKYSIMKMSI